MQPLLFTGFLKYVFPPRLNHVSIWRGKEQAMSYSTEQLLKLGKDVIEEAEKDGAKLRLLGGIAFYLNAPNARNLPQFQRVYKDLDFAVNSKGTKAITKAFKKLGWTDDQQFNALHGATRMLFYYGEELDLQVDIFVGVFEQCHKLTFEKRLSLNSPTLPLADLLLTKLEIHQLNRKDVLDLVMLLYDHDFGLHQTDEKRELQYILDLTGSDWGWYTTVHDNLGVIENMAGEFLEGDDLSRVKETLNWIRTSMETAPKSLKWKMRSSIGRKMQWYELPEEVNR